MQSFIIFGRMKTMTCQRFYSRSLKKDFTIDFFIPERVDSNTWFLILNDGQLSDELFLEKQLEEQEKKGHYIFAVAVYASEARLQEYGVAHFPDYKKRGTKANQYAYFITQELMLFVSSTFRIQVNPRMSMFAGFSLGALSAFDIAWNYPSLFQTVGLFSGSFWWRYRAFTEEDPDAHRIMHEVIRSSFYKPGYRFWFEAGTNDEFSDRNNNGIIDSIDDTLDLIKELENLGYSKENIRYLEIPGGRHEPSTWAKAMPHFLEWSLNSNNG